MNARCSGKINERSVTDDVNGARRYLLREVAAARLPSPVPERRVAPAVACALEARVQERAVLPVNHRGIDVPHPYPVGVVAATGVDFVAVVQERPRSEEGPGRRRARHQRDDGEREQKGQDGRASSVHGSLLSTLVLATIHRLRGERDGASGDAKSVRHGQEGFVGTVDRHGMFGFSAKSVVASLGQHSG
jgi:hypothetical protein